MRKFEDRGYLNDMEQRFQNGGEIPLSLVQFEINNQPAWALVGGEDARLRAAFDYVGRAITETHDVNIRGVLTHCGLDVKDEGWGNPPPEILSLFT